MWLAIDIGNTNVHIGVFEKDALQHAYSVKSGLPQPLQMNLAQILNPATFSKARAAILSSVSPKVEASVIEYVQKYLLIKPKSIGKDIPIPIKILAEQPENIGIDRLVNALAAFERTKGWTIIVDAGTAITVDVINDKGAFMGGIIAPGIDISSKALHHFTALLPEIAVKKPKYILGKNTGEAINSGVYWGTIGMVNRLIEMLCDDLKCQPAIIATGGNADMLAEEIPHITDVVPYLTLDGIRIAYKTILTSNTQY